MSEPADESNNPFLTDEEKEALSSSREGTATADGAGAGKGEGETILPSNPFYEDIATNPFYSDSLPKADRSPHSASSRSHERPSHEQSAPGPADKPASPAKDDASSGTGHTVPSPSSPSPPHPPAAPASTTPEPALPVPAAASPEPAPQEPDAQARTLLPPQPSSSQPASTTAPAPSSSASASSLSSDHAGTSAPSETPGSAASPKPSSTTLLLDSTVLALAPPTFRKAVPHLAQLVIGNASYEDGQAHPTAVQDAELLHASLASLGFDGKLFRNLNKQEFQEVVFAFVAHVKQLGPQTVVVVSFHGHAVQIQDENYLVPSGAALSDPRRAARNCISVEAVFAMLKDMDAECTLLLLDTARSNGFKAKWVSWINSPAAAELEPEEKLQIRQSAVALGMAPLEPPPKFITVTAAAPGSREDPASSGDLNSLFTKSLVSVISHRFEQLVAHPHLSPVSIHSLLALTSELVQDESDSHQFPMVQSALAIDVYFAPASASASPASSLSPSPSSSSATPTQLAGLSSAVSQTSWACFCSDLPIDPLIFANNVAGSAELASVYYSFHHHPHAAFALGLSHEEQAAALHQKLGVSWLAALSSAALQQASSPPSYSSVFPDALPETLETVKKHYSEAHRHYSIAASHNHGPALYCLGRLFQRGLGVALDDKEAQRHYQRASSAKFLEWFKRAALHDSSFAQFHLARCCHLGIGLPKDKSEAVAWYRRASDQSSASAQFNLALLLSSGVPGVLQPNPAEGARLFEAAALQGVPDAMYEFGSMKQEGKLMPKDMSEAVRYFTVAAGQGNAHAQTALALCYASGNGVRQDEAEAYRLLRNASNHKEPNALFNLGVMYLRGRAGLPVDRAEAARLFRQSAEAGVVRAQCALGRLYQAGRGVEQNLSEAFKWFKLASEGGDPSAQVSLGLMFYHGQGIPKNVPEAVKLFRLAAGPALEAQASNGTLRTPPAPASESASGGKAGSDLHGSSSTGTAPGLDGEAHAIATACFNLGWAYMNGEGGLPVNKVEAAKLYRFAADKGLSFAQQNLALMLLHGDGIPVDQKDAVHYLALASEQGDAEAQYNLALLYLEGIGVEEGNAREGIRLLRLAAEKQLPDALVGLASCYLEGRGGLEKDEEEAANLYKKAGELGNVVAIGRLGVMYLHGCGVAKNEQEALRLIRRAAEQSDDDASFTLGWMYAKGVVVAKNDKEAVKWLQRAASNGHPDAQTHLGWMYENGLGVLKSEAEAAKWYQHAGENGNADARYNLAVMYERGRGVPKNDAEAIRWYELAALQGRANASEALVRLRAKEHQQPAQ